VMGLLGWGLLAAIVAGALLMALRRSDEQIGKVIAAAAG
jgi:hypothetical protein